MQIYRVRRCALPLEGFKLKSSFASSHIQIKGQDTMRAFLDQRWFKGERSVYF